MTYNPDNPNEHAERQEDLWEDAMSDEPGRFFGTLTVNVWKCVLEKGAGKVPYDPAQHQGRRTSVAIELTIAPVDPAWKLITRQTLNWVSEFKGVIRPSVEALAPRIAEITGQQVGQFNPLKTLNGMWVGGQFVPRPDNKPGETWTTLQFTDVYASHEECEAAANAWAEEQGWGGDGASEAAGDGQDAQRRALQAFLPAMWSQAGGGDGPMTSQGFKEAKAKFVELLEANTMVYAHFPPDAPEVQAILGAVEVIPF